MNDADAAHDGLLLYVSPTFSLLKSKPSLRLTRHAKHLQRGDTVWLTTGKCTETLGWFSLSAAPKPVVGRPDVGGDYATGKRCIEYRIRRGSVLDDRIPIRRMPGSQRLWIPGEVAIARRVGSTLRLVSNRLDGAAPTSHSWRPWTEPDPRLEQLRALVADGDRGRVFAWFRKKSSLPQPTLITAAARTGRQTTELDHLVPVRILVDRLLDGTLSVDEVPAVLVIVECTTSDHRWITYLESDEHRAAMRVCPTADLLEIAGHRYGRHIQGLLHMDGTRAYSDAALRRAAHKADRYSTP